MTMGAERAIGLQNQALEGCTLDLKGGATETLDSRWRSIGDRWWVEAKLNDAVLI